ncbi:hypothetical protein [Pedobacter mucosus]|uniref:hypothetical protein n=1 Tax=Pedobacter mucosus TaxID=2895286 RepID=UPI001EE44405|nr:hypothetical protein [Pedobacter mucosus]UKT62391.1 hypothetical protein LOK61_11535 [Pedobacter mucosus]
MKKVDQLKVMVHRLEILRKLRMTINKEAIYERSSFLNLFQDLISMNEKHENGGSIKGCDYRLKILRKLRMTIHKKSHTRTVVILNLFQDLIRMKEKHKNSGSIKGCGLSLGDSSQTQNDNKTKKRWSFPSLYNLGNLRICVINHFSATIFPYFANATERVSLITVTFICPG